MRCKNLLQIIDLGPKSRVEMSISDQIRFFEKVGNFQALSTLNKTSIAKSLMKYLA